AASNRLPEEEALQALFDRFLLRVRVENLPREAMPRLLAAGWALESAKEAPSSVTTEDIRALSRRVLSVDLSAVSELYADSVFKVRDLGVTLSDRRAVKVLKLVAASALLCGREKAQPSDLWVLRYVWEREEQIGPLAGLVNAMLEPHARAAQSHPLAAPPSAIDAEALAREL